MHFTVEVVTTPVVDDDWSVLWAAIDAVPGAVLLEYADAPTLVFPVEADSAMKAATFVEGLSQVVGFTVVGGTISNAPDDDFAEPENGETVDPSTEAIAVQSWLDDIPPVPHVRHERALA